MIARHPTSILRLREFQALLGARLTASLAMSALATAVAFQTYEITRDPLALGLLGLVEAIPALSLALFGGHLADRRDRRSIVLVTTSLMTVGVLALAFLSLDSGRVGLPGILAVIFLVGIAAGFDRPALTALEAQVIPDEHIATGTSWTSTVSQFGAIAGPAIGGIVYAFVGASGTYLWLAALLGISTACVAVIGRKPIPPVVADEGIRRSLTGGVRYVLRSRILLGSMALDLFAVLFGGAIALLPVFATEILHVGPAGLGLLRTAPSVGALAVMLVATRRPPAAHAGPILLVAVAGFGVSIIVFALSRDLVISLLALFMSGVTDGISMVIRSIILRVASPDHLRGRIASVNWVFIGASNEIGAFESGVAARLFGVIPSVVGGGVVTLLVVAAVAILVPELRRLDLTRPVTPVPTPTAVSVAMPSSDPRSHR